MNPMVKSNAAILCHSHERLHLLDLDNYLDFSLTSKDLFSYSFMAVMHWCFVLMLVVTPAFTIVSLPVGGWKVKKHAVKCWLNNLIYIL